MKKRSDCRQQEIDRIHQLSTTQAADDFRLNPGYQHHEHLFQIVTMLPVDYKPYGERNRDNFGDCSSGCRWYHPLAGKRGEDWGVCANPASHRAGLLTFEHQGCPQFELDNRWEYLLTAEGNDARRRFEDLEAKLKAYLSGK